MHARQEQTCLRCDDNLGVPDDDLVAPGTAYSVRDFIERAIACVDRTIEWRGVGVGEEVVDAKSGDVLGSTDPVNFRPNEVDEMSGDPTKARETLGWRHRIPFDEFVRQTVESDLANSEGPPFLANARLRF